MSPGALRRAMGTWPWFVATAGGLGHLWPASGTWGSLPPVVLYSALGWWMAPGWLQVLVQLALGAAACRGCLRHGGAVERLTGRKDPGVVVIDEVAGMAFTLALSVVGMAVAQAVASGAVSEGLRVMQEGPPRTLMLATAAGSFFWFRVMDVIKPPPARALQSLPGGLGVLIDDVVVAPYAAIAFVASLETWVRVQPVG